MEVAVCKVSEVTGQRQVSLGCCFVRFHLSKGPSKTNESDIQHVESYLSDLRSIRPSLFFGRVMYMGCNTSRSGSVATDLLSHKYQVSIAIQYPIFQNSGIGLNFTTNQETSRLRTKMIMRSSFSFPQCLLNGFQVLLCNLSTATQSLRQISSMATSFNHHLK